MAAGKRGLEFSLGPRESAAERPAGVVEIGLRSVKRLGRFDDLRSPDLVGSE